MQVSASRGRLIQLAAALKRGSAVQNARQFFPLRAVSSRAPSAETSKQQQLWDIRILYDGECPLCLKEIAMLKRRDAGQNKISFVNIATPDYDPDEHSGVSYGKAMGRMHGILPDGTVVEGVEVFRRCYDIVGLGWVYAMTSLPPVERFANMVYDIWARYRLPLTGRVAEGIEEMKYWNTPPSGCADEESCEIPWDDETEPEEQEK